MAIYLFRHGEAFQIGEIEGVHSDDQRPLTPKGKKATSKVCRGLMELGVGCDEIWHSPLVRAVETARIVSEEMRCTNLVEKGGLAYVDESEELFLSLKDLDPEKDLFLVGHQPYIAEWTVRLMTGMVNDHVSVSKSGVVCLELIPGCDPPMAELRWLLRSKHLQTFAKD